MDAKLISATGRMRVSRPHLTHYNSYILHTDIYDNEFLYTPRNWLLKLYAKLLLYVGNSSQISKSG